MISVIIPTFNRKLETISAINSVLNQSDLSVIIEIIVVDDGSTDGTYQAVRDFLKAQKMDKPTFRLIKKLNGGAASARNAGMKIAIGEYIAFLDSDDKWSPSKLKEQWCALQNNKQIDMLGCDAVGMPLAMPFRRSKKLFQVSVLEMWVRSLPVTPSVIIKKCIFEKIGGFDEDIKRYEDCHYWQKICLSGYKVYHLNQGLVQLSEKKQYGESGLSADIELTYHDILLSISKLKSLGYISPLMAVILRVWEFFKYYRRKILSYEL
jgi:glycosyltransferase involved in cell wall biosynthesis